MGIHIHGMIKLEIMSSRTFPSTGEKPKFNPDAAYEAVQESPAPKGSKPAFNPNKKFEAVGEQSTQQANQTQQFTPMTDWLNIQQQGYQPMDQANVVPIDPHTINTAKAADRVRAEVETIDPHIGNLIYEKKKDLTGRIKSQELGINPREAAPLNPQAAQLESQLREDISVAPEEIAEFKAGMNENQVMARQALTQKVKDLAKTEPARANMLKGDVYRLDRQANPEKEENIAKNIEKINRGEYDYDIVNGRLVKPLGFFPSVINAFKEKGKSYDDYDVYQSGDEKKILDRIYQRLDNDPDKAVPIPSGVDGEAGALLGGQPLKPIIAAAGAGLLSGGTAAAAAGAAVSAPEMYKLTFGAQLPHNYDAIRKLNPDLTNSEVLQQAINLTHDQANSDALSGAAMGAIGVRGALKPATSLLLQRSIKSALKEMGETVAVQGIGGGAIGAGSQLVKNLMAQKAGIPVDESEGMAQQLVGGAFMTLGMAIAGKAGTILKPSTYNKILHGLSKLPEETISSELNKAQEVGALTPEEAQRVQTDIAEQRKVDASIRGDMPESDRIKVQEKIKQRNIKDKELEIAHKAYHPKIKEEIKNLDDDIVALSEGGERGKLQQLVDKSKIEGAAKAYFEDLSEKELGDAFKEIADQAHDPESANQAIEVFGEEIVNKAKELYPQEVPKESKISVIQPGEIKQPEIITIQPKGGESQKYIQPTEKYTPTDDSFTHLTNSKEAIDELIRTGRFIGKGESLGNFNLEVSTDSFSLSRDNAGSPYFQKGKFYGEPTQKYLIVAKGDEKFTPNINHRNAESFENSKGVGVLKPEFRDISNLQIYERVGDEYVPYDVAGHLNEPSVNPTKGGLASEQGISQGGIGEPPMPPVESKGIFVEHPETQLSFRGLQETANEFGFEDVKSRDRVSDIQERKNAEMEVNEWASKGEYQKNIDDLLGRIERKEMAPVARQRLILEQYLANEKQKARDLYGTPEHDTQLNKVERIKKIGEIARQETAASLRLPNERSGVHPINDEADAMIAKKEANSVDRLTDQQKAEVKEQVEEYKKASDEANAKAAAFEEQASKVDAEREFKKVKSSTKRIKKTAEERAAFRRTEIEAAREALRKLRSGESGLSAVPLPGVRELIAIAPHVKNIMVDLVAQGVDNLQDVVKQLRAEFNDVLDGITEKDIHDIIAGAYNEKGRPLTELQRQIKDLQDEAKLINQYESLVNGKEPKTERAKIERNQKIKELRDKIKSFKQEESEANKFSKEEVDDDAKKLIAIKKRNQKREQEIKEKISKGQFEKETKKSIFDREDLKKTHPRLRKDALDAIAKKEEAQHKFDLALFNDEMKQRKWYQKAGSIGAKVIHTSKAVMSGIDDSATFVQNGLAMLANPKIGAKVWLEHWKDAFSDKRFKRELAALHERPDWEIIKNSGLDIVEPHSAASKQVEEAFEQNLLAGKVKISGKEFQPWKYTGGIFERAFTSMGNNMRLALFEKQMAALKEEGKTFESHPKEFKDAARVINELTGRGKLPAGIAQASPYITPFVWAPRMLTSTINTLGFGEIMGLRGKGYYQNLTPMQRKFALSQLGRGIGIGVAVMVAAALGGAKVDYDPRSVTFGDVIIGDHHYNVFGRYVPVVKAIVQASMGERVKKDGIQDLDSGKRGAKTRMGVVGGFFRGKMTPFAGAMYDLAEHKNYYTNKPFGIKDLPEATLQPMSIKELREGWENDGTWTILNRFLPAFEGLKVSDERDFNKKEESAKTGTSRKSSKGGKPKKPTKN